MRVDSLCVVALDLGDHLPAEADLNQALSVRQTSFALPSAGYVSPKASQT